MASIKEKAKKAVSEITRVLFGDEQTFKEATLADGTTVIKIDGEVAEGAMVTDSEGKPVADGDYTLSDGTVITCAEGKITTVKMPETGTEEMAATATVEERMANLEALVKTLMGTEKTREQAYQASMKAADKKITALETSNKDIKEAFRAVMEVVQELAEQPAAASAEPDKGTFSKEKLTPEQRIAKFKEIVDEYRKNN